MRFNLMNVAQESIDFQDGTLFNQLTALIEDIMDDAELAKLDDKNFFKQNKLVEIEKLFKKVTNLSFVLTPSFNGPAIMVPMVNNNHIFFDDQFRTAIEVYGKPDGFTGHQDIDNLMYAMKTSLLKGEIDLKKARVSGVFAEIEVKLLMPKADFRKKGTFTAQEVAGVILHEVGHMFTYMEFLSRCVSTNQVLAGLVRATDKSMPADKREVVFAKGAELLSMTKEQQQAALNAKSQAEVCCIVLDAAMQKSVSELGVSIYDSVSCEYLADQFATRMGGGRYIVSYLDKLNKLYGAAPSAPDSYFVSVFKVVLMLVGHIFMAILSGGVWLLFIALIIACADKSNNIYDNDAFRFTRIKHQNIERLKNPNISKEEKANLVEDNEVIEKIGKYYKDELNMLEKIAYYLKPSYRNAHKYELLQKDLEKLANNNLFQMSAKLSLI